jgi:hypothetical protein
VGFVKHEHERAKHSDVYFFHGFNVTGLVDLEDDCKCVFEHLLFHCAVPFWATAGNMTSAPA